MTNPHRLTDVQYEVLQLIRLKCSNGSCHIGYEDMKRELEYEASVRQIIRSVRHLIDEGLIDVTVGGGRGVMNVYRVV